MARDDREASLANLEEFEDAISGSVPEVSVLAVSKDRRSPEKNDSPSVLKRARSKSEIDELRSAFDRADKAKSGEIDRDSLREVLKSDETRAVRKAKSGKFDVEELESLANAVDVDNSGTTSFNELVQVLGAAETLANSPASTSGNEDSKIVEDRKISEGDDEWEREEKKYTSGALVRHRRKSAARRSATCTTTIANSSDQTDVSTANAAVSGEERKSAAAGGKVVIQAPKTTHDAEKCERVPSIRVDQNDCACTCLVM